MPTDRFSLGLAAALGGDPAVRTELEDHLMAELRDELVARAVADAASARTAGGGPAGLVRALADLTGTGRTASPTRRGPRGPYRPAPDPGMVTTILALRASGASLTAIGNKVGRHHTTVRAVIARYEQATGTVVTPARIVGRDGIARPARHTPPSGIETTRPAPHGERHTPASIVRHESTGRMDLSR